MISILKKIYYSNLNKSGFLHSDDPECCKLNDQMAEILMQLKQKVAEDDFKLIIELLDINNEGSALEGANAFVYGFKFGSLMVFEVLSDKQID